jgi:hypothetical protein
VAFGYGGIGLALLLSVFGLAGPANARELTVIATNLTLGTAPLAVKLTPEPDLASALNAGKPLPMVLAIEGIEGAAAQPVRINVFVDKPDADNLTPTTDPRCVGFIQLLPVRGEVRRTGIALEMPMIRYSDFGQSISITLVPVVGTDNRAPRDVALRVARLYIRELH